MDVYRSRLQVHAAKIEGIAEIPDEGIFIILNSSRSVKVTPEYVMRYRPNVGGYYMVYLDGTESYLPHNAFDARFEKL